MVFKFGSLKVWQLAVDMADEIDLVACNFLPHELYSLASQIRRAANSICLNIVEGSTGLSNAEFKRFLQIANRSALEVVSCLFLAKRPGYIDSIKFSDLYTKLETWGRMIQSLLIH
ncbi:MAG: four helix bundle protein [Chitinophagaceae bacterium]